MQQEIIIVHLRRSISILVHGRLTAFFLFDRLMNKYKVNQSISQSMLCPKEYKTVQVRANRWRSG